MSAIEWSAQHLPHISACAFACLAAATAPYQRITTQLRAWAARRTRPITLGQLGGVAVVAAVAAIAITTVGCIFLKVLTIFDQTIYPNDLKG